MQLSCEERKYLKIGSSFVLLDNKKVKVKDKENITPGNALIFDYINMVGRIHLR